ncbi:unnamed protein product [Prunus armeniaca]|uniref:Uncharacterized protein n=1 Tax=Prunus armeniaca TaxID=36596 RepID=A0A6J5WP39_PRUAR|nr:unnamed protein product [Prunus armeniaca]
MESQMCGGVEEEKKYVACREGVLRREREMRREERVAGVRFQRKQTENWIEKYHGCEVELTTGARDGSKRRRSRSLSHSLSSPMVGNSDLTVLRARRERSEDGVAVG